MNVSSHTYGILAWDNGTPIVAPLLPRNQPVPFSYVSGEGGMGLFGLIGSAKILRRRVA